MQSLSANATTQNYQELESAVWCRIEFILTFKTSGRLGSAALMPLAFLESSPYSRLFFFLLFLSSLFFFFFFFLILLIREECINIECTGKVHFSGGVDETIVCVHAFSNAVKFTESKCRGWGWGGGVLGQHMLHLTSSWHFDLRPLTGVNRAPCFHNWRLLLSLGFWTPSSDAFYFCADIAKTIACWHDVACWHAVARWHAVAILPEKNVLRCNLKCPQRRLT